MREGLINYSRSRRAVIAVYRKNGGLQGMALRRRTIGPSSCETALGGMRARLTKA